MMIDSIPAYDDLVSHPALADLPVEWLRRLAVHGTPVRLPAGRLVREGGPADRFWLLSSGMVELDFRSGGCGQVPIERIGGGTMLGWSWLTPPYRWPLGVVVVEPCRAIQLEAEPVRLLIATDRAFGIQLTTRVLAVAEQRLETARRRFLELCA